MRKTIRKIANVLVVMVCITVVAGGIVTSKQFLANAAATIGLCLWGITLVPFRRQRKVEAAADKEGASSNEGEERVEGSHESAADEVVADLGKGNDENASATLISTMLDEGRFALLLRPQIIDNLSLEQEEVAIEELDDSMSLVPEGDVLMRSPFRNIRADVEEMHDRTVRVEAFYLDRHPVTNAEFLRFVESGGYEQMSLWESDALAGLLDFVDSTGRTGPALWNDGKPVPGTEDHPVVGVCWYEASAYARWTGKRLPTDPEWVKAAGWPVATAQGAPLQRSYPWGDIMDRDRANLRKSGSESTVSVASFEEGDTVGGIRQMIGNVWEWMHSDFGQWSDDSEPLILPQPMKGLRGGAYNTYFDLQASCDFASGDSVLARRNNIGFRCAIGLCDLAMERVLGDVCDDSEIGDSE